MINKVLSILLITTIIGNAAIASSCFDVYSDVSWQIDNNSKSFEEEVRNQQFTEFGADSLKVVGGGLVVIGVVGGLSGGWWNKRSDIMVYGFAVAGAGFLTGFLGQMLKDSSIKQKKEVIEPKKLLVELNKEFKKIIQMNVDIDLKNEQNYLVLVHDVQKLNVKRSELEILTKFKDFMNSNFCKEAHKLPDYLTIVKLIATPGLGL